jgi:hypothetical protein
MSEISKGYMIGGRLFSCGLICGESFCKLEQKGHVIIVDGRAELVEAYTAKPNCHRKV